MAELLFITPVEKKDITKPTWRGIPRVSLTRPAVAHEIDPIQPVTKPVAEKKTRESIQVGKIAIILDGEFKGCRAVVINENGNGLVKLYVPLLKKVVEIDQDYLIATSTKLEIGEVDENGAENAIKAAADKIPEMNEYLNTKFSLKASDRPHLMKF